MEGRAERWLTAKTHPLPGDSCERVFKTFKSLASLDTKTPKRGPKPRRYN